MTRLNGWQKHMSQPSNGGAYIFRAFVFIIIMGITLYVTYPTPTLIQLGIGLSVALLSVFSVHIAMEWEKSVILSLGKFSRIAGPGLFFTIPIIESVTITIDQRMITTPFMAEETLTADAVPINVDAVLFWMVWDPRRAAIEAENYSEAVSWAAQTSMRDIIGRTTLAKILSAREQLDEELRTSIDHKTEPWGVSVVSVEIRDIVIPRELQDAMSKEAQAVRERQARIILSGAEKDISEMFVEVSQAYKDNPLALQLRAMNLIYESVKESGGMVVVPSSFAEAFSSNQNTASEKEQGEK